MEIIIKRKFPAFLSLKKKCNKFVTKNKKIELPDELIEKTSLIIDELFERASQPRGDNQEGKDKDKNVLFPLIPSSFYQVVRELKDGVREIAGNTKWAEIWYGIPSKNIATERFIILNKLHEAEFVWINNFEELEKLEVEDVLRDGHILVDLHRDKLIKFKNRLPARQERHKKVAGKVSFEYKNHKNNVIEGKLRIEDYAEILFKKMPARILNFFYVSKGIDEYKNFNDFNAFLAEEQHVGVIGSDDFSKKINAINKRVKRETNELIKNIIIKMDNKKVDANMYRWNKNI